MALQTKTIDSIVKELLIDLQLPMHYYVKLLYYVLDEYNRISLIQGLGFKQVEITHAGAGVKASGTHDSVTYTAVEYGTPGNSITLTFNGSDSILVVLDAWNTANPTNTVTTTADTSTIPAAGSVTLSGGLNPGRAQLPSDVAKVIGVYMSFGERLRELPRDYGLSLVYNTNDTGGRILHPSANWGIDIIDPAPEEGTDGRYVDYTIGSDGGMYGLSISSDYRWNLDELNSEIVFSNKTPTTTTFVLVYATTSVSSSVANVVHLPFVDSLKEYAKLKRLESNRAPANAVERQRQTYNKVKRIMRAHLKPIRYTDILKSIRGSSHAAIK